MNVLSNSARYLSVFITNLSCFLVSLLSLSTRNWSGKDESSIPKNIKLCARTTDYISSWQIFCKKLLLISPLVSWIFNVSSGQIKFYTIRPCVLSYEATRLRIATTLRSWSTVWKVIIQDLVLYSIQFLTKWCWKFWLDGGLFIFFWWLF